MATEEAVDGLDQPDPDNTDADGQVVADPDQPEAGGSVANFSREPLSLRIKVFLFFSILSIMIKIQCWTFFLKTPNFLEDKWSPASLRLWAGTFGQPGRFRRRRGLSKPSSHRWRIWGGFGLNFPMFSSSVNRYLQDQAQEGQVAILQRTLHGCINLFSPEEFSISFPSLMKANWVRFTFFLLSFAF